MVFETTIKLPAARKLIPCLFSLLRRFLFYKDSAPYKQYEALIQQFKKEIVKPPDMEDSTDIPGEKYEPEMALEDDFDVRTVTHRDTADNEVGICCLFLRCAVKKNHSSYRNVRIKMRRMSERENERVDGVKKIPQYRHQ